MRRLTIVSVSYPFARVGPDAVGGAEQILTAIDRALVRAGHRSIVIATEGSFTSGELAPLPAPDEAHTLDDLAISERHARVSEALRRVLAEATVDLVHMHGIDFHRYLPPPGVPVLATLHLPLAWYPAHALASDRPATWLNCVSANQAASAEPNPSMLPMISNGVPVDDLEAPQSGRRDYALMLARVCPEKGQHLALQAAHAANTELLIGGEVFPYGAHHDYFAARVRPLLDTQRRYLGPIGLRRKRSLLAGARCLLIPSLAAETSSLVAMEAASCGTPVIAFRVGALPELVEHGRTGFVVDDVNSMVEAMRHVDVIDRQTCRAVARDRFPVDMMTSAYIGRYTELATSAAHSAA